MTTKASAQGLKPRTISIGTPGYMPSEQIDGNPQLSSDVYAVGIIGIQALTGLSPHVLDSGSKIHEIVWRNKAPKVSRKLAGILEKMVRRDYNQRYQDATEALKALKSLNTTPVFLFPLLLLLLLAGALGLLSVLVVLGISKKQSFDNPPIVTKPEAPKYESVKIVDDVYSPWVEGRDKYGGSAEFKTAVLSIGYRWKVGESNFVEDKNKTITLTQLKSQIEKKGEIFKQIENPNKIISVGTASCEADSSQEDPRTREEARALQRAKQLQKLVSKELFSVGEYKLLNLGQFKSDSCKRHPDETSLQRSIIMIGVRKETPGVILDQALRDKFQQELNNPKNKIQNYSVNLNNYSLGSEDKFRLIIDNTP